MANVVILCRDMTMKAHTMAAADFKAKCLAVLDDVEAGGGAVIITKRGRPVAQLVALPGARAQDIRGSVLAGLDEALEPVAAAWKASR